MNHSTDPFARSQTSTAIRAWRLDTRPQTYRSAARVGESKAPKELSRARIVSRDFMHIDRLFVDAVQDERTRAWSKMQSNALSPIRDAQTRVFLPPYFEFITPSIFTPPRKSDALRRMEYHDWVISESFRKWVVEGESDQNGVENEAEPQSIALVSPLLVGIMSRPTTHPQNSDVDTNRRKSNKISELESRTDRSKILPPCSNATSRRQKPPSWHHYILEGFPDCPICFLESAMVRSAPFLCKLKTRLHCRKLDAETTPLRPSARSASTVSTRKKSPCIWGVEPIDIAVNEFPYESRGCYAFPANLSNLLQIKLFVACPARRALFQLHDDIRKTLFGASDNWNTKIKKADVLCVERFISKYVPESIGDLPESYRILGESCRSEEFAPRRSECIREVTN